MQEIRCASPGEKSVRSSESFLKLAMIRLMLHRLEPSEGSAEFRYPRPVAA
jgi:putative transposase